MFNSQLEGRTAPSLKGSCEFPLLSQYFFQSGRAMNRNFEKQTLDGNQWDASALVCYKCPSCNMLTWHSSRLKGVISCPFCCNGLPEYVTRVVPQTMARSDEAAQKVEKSLMKPAGRWALEPMAEEQNGKSPFIIEFFMVQGAGFKCMAYLNDDGKWHEAFNGEVLPGAIRVLE